MTRVHTRCWVRVFVIRGTDCHGKRNRTACLDPLTQSEGYASFFCIACAASSFKGSQCATASHALRPSVRSQRLCACDGLSLFLSFFTSIPLHIGAASLHNRHRNSTTRATFSFEVWRTSRPLQGDFRNNRAASAATRVLIVSHLRDTAREAATSSLFLTRAGSHSLLSLSAYAPIDALE